MAGRGGARPGAGRKKKVIFTQLTDVQLDAPIELSKGYSSFSEEQMAILSQSPHVDSVTKKTISYTLIFKEAFWRRYMKGVMPDKYFATLALTHKCLARIVFGDLSHHLEHLLPMVYLLLMGGSLNLSNAKNYLTYSLLLMKRLILKT